MNLSCRITAISEKWSIVRYGSVNFYALETAWPPGTFPNVLSSTLCFSRTAMGHFRESFLANAERLTGSSCVTLQNFFAVASEGG